MINLKYTHQYNCLIQLNLLEFFVLHVLFICICVLSNMRENSCCSIFWFLIHYYQCLFCLALLACPPVHSPCTLLRRPIPQNACHGLVYVVF